MTLRHVVFDFDGTCTDVPAVHQAYLEEYRRLLALEVAPCPHQEWEHALEVVRGRSPQEGWMLGGAPSAPAAADPYILGGEAAAWLSRTRRWTKPLPRDLHARAVVVGEAPFRPECARVLGEVAATGVAVHFISNSETATVSGRLDRLLAGDPTLRARIHVQGSAAKFAIREPPLDPALGTPPISPRLRAAFAALPGEAPRQLDRPIYLRRGAYLAALATLWGDDPAAPAATLVCGDIWELDLAMPAALGCAVHLIERGAPYQTYPYERAALARTLRGGSSATLDGAAEHVRALLRG